MSKTKIAHVSLLPKFSPGIVKKLEGCAKDSISRNLGIDYVVVAPESSRVGFEGVEFVNMDFVNGASKIGERFSQMLAVKKLKSSYDMIVLRYPGADLGPFVIGFKLGNCIGEHHTLIVEEYDAVSPFRAFVERALGGLWLGAFKGHIGVTQQILDDVLDRSWSRDQGKFSSVLPNPYNFTDVVRKGCFRKKSVYTGVISASAFMPWHGLDRVIELFSGDGGDKFELLVVGDVSSTRNDAFYERLKSAVNVRFLGSKSSNELAEIYRNCDFSLNSFGLDRLNMSTGSTLKLREYLDFSIPVISPLPDSGLPDGFPYIHIGGDSLEEISGFLDGLDGTDFSVIKQSARHYLGVERFNDALVNLGRL